MTEDRGKYIYPQRESRDTMQSRKQDMLLKELREKRNCDILLENTKEVPKIEKNKRIGKEEKNIVR